jgi:hypothetical protein
VSDYDTARTTITVRQVAFEALRTWQTMTRLALRVSGRQTRFRGRLHEEARNLGRFGRHIRLRATWHSGGEPGCPPAQPPRSPWRLGRARRRGCPRRRRAAGRKGGVALDTCGGDKWELDHELALGRLVRHERARYRSRRGNLPRALFANPGDRHLRRLLVHADHRELRSEPRPRTDGDSVDALAEQRPLNGLRAVAVTSTSCRTTCGWASTTTRSRR